MSDPQHAWQNCARGRVEHEAGLCAGRVDPASGEPVTRPSAPSEDAAIWRNGYEAGANGAARSFIPEIPPRRRAVLAAALADAIEARRPDTSACNDCARLPEGRCPDHEADYNQAASYLALAIAMGLDLS